LYGIAQWPETLRKPLSAPIRTPRMERVTFHQSHRWPEIEVREVSQSTRLWTRFHSTYAFSAMAVAASRWVYRRQLHSATPGTVVVMEPGEMHVTVTARRPASFRTLFIAPRWFDEASRELGWRGAPHFARAWTANPAVYSSLALACRSLSESANELEQQSNILTCARLLLRNAAENVPADRALRREPAKFSLIRRHLEDRYAEEVTLGELAVVSGMTRFSVLRLFRLHAGTTPHGFLRHFRLERACEMLKLGIPAGQVAQSVGFYDQSHLNRHFSRVFGISPGRYATATKVSPAVPTR
jgi:AraC-like DNA-binding protein